MTSINTYTIQDRTPYTYLIRWNQLDLNYYGRRTAKDCHPEEFFISYFTSSNYVSDIIAEYGMPDIIKIHKIFSDVDSCKLQEERFLKRVNAAKSLRWINQTNGDKKFDKTGKPNVYSIKSKINMSIAQQNRYKFPVPDTAKENMKLAALNRTPRTEEHKKNNSNAKKKFIKLIDPSGIEYYCKGVTDFCIQHKLNRNKISQLARGLIPYYKGWKCEFI